ncbi:MAG: sel1 repeat family protein [Campylobacteraceae bacterium]|jgi:TPR repeat protein|nr:sel1 repeat family protein [Campylobacteraceae bacterium]
MKKILVLLMCLIGVVLADKDDDVAEILLAEMSYDECTKKANIQACFAAQYRINELCKKRVKKTCDFVSVMDVVIGNYYYGGKGGEQNYTKALEYFEKSCSGNHASEYGCAKVGGLYYLGQVIEQDYFKAFKYTKKACDLESGSGCNILGILYEEGKGVRQDYKKAKKYFGKACDLGEQFGCDKYTRYNRDGH